MLKTTYFLIFCLFLSCSRLNHSVTLGQSAQAPNIVFILADDLGYGELGCFGQDKIKTPHIDALAREGLKLTSHYSGSPVCAPSRCTLLTGLHTGHATVRNNREMGGWGPEEPEGQYPLPENTNSLGKSLQSLGYKTGCFGKWGLGGPDSTGHPNNQGFDYFYGYLCQRVAHNYYPTHLWRNNEIDFLEGNEEWFSAHQKIQEEPTSFESFAGGTYAPDKVIDEAVSFIDQHADEPFFLYYASIIPHLALQIPDDELEVYPDSWDTKPYLGGKGYLPHPKPRAAYAAMITRFDSEVGAIMKALKGNGIADNTIVVVTSDNGPSWVGGVDMEFFGSQGGLHGRKAQLFEGGIRVPAVVWWPHHIDAGTTSDMPSAFWDWYPTLTSIAGGDSGACDGVNLTPSFMSNAQLGERGFYWEFGSSQAYRNGPWKLLRIKSKNGIETHLYHLEDDLGETTNLASQLPQQVHLLQQQATEMHEESKVFTSFLDENDTGTP